jgi:hypothetical protein
MENYNQEATQTVKLPIGKFEMVAAIGFFIMIISNFFSFAPIEERTWREIGVGIPVIFACLGGMALIFRRDFFSSFFIAMFCAFFITHEIIICYDNRAVEMGKELGAEGWFRPVVMIFKDAMNPSFCTFWALSGISLALAAIITGWLFQVYQGNKKALPEFQKETPELNA